MKKISHYCGYISIIGKQNVGKSTILNKIMGKKISITSCKPGTTQNHILGIKTKKQYQLIYIDTPGINKTEKKNKIFTINNNITLILFVVNKTNWSEIDELILNKIKKFNIPIILIIKKIDMILNKKKLLPYIDKLQKKHNFMEIIPTSAKNEENIDILVNKIKKNIPKANHIFPKEYITNVSLFFIISEIIREKIIRLLGKEIPYLIKVKINSYKIIKFNLHYIEAFILVQNNRHKKIIIGKNGEKIKLCSIMARKDIEKKIKKSVYLKIWVKNTK